MPSQRRSDAARANGAKSRGPVTPEGRARSNSAAVTHGLTARRVLLENESEDDFRALRDLYLVQFQPRNPFEADLVEQLVAARWRLDRVWSYETALLEIEIGRSQPDIDEEFKSCSVDIRNALAFRSLYDESRVLSGLSRYESRYRRICDKLVKILQSLRSNQKLSEEPKDPGPKPLAGPPPAPPQDSPAPQDAPPVCASASFHPAEPLAPPPVCTSATSPAPPAPAQSPLSPKLVECSQGML